MGCEALGCHYQYPSDVIYKYDNLALENYVADDVFLDKNLESTIVKGVITIIFNSKSHRHSFLYHGLETDVLHQRDIVF